MNDPADILESVLETFANLDIEVRREWLGGEGGGLCTIRGERIFFLDLAADLATRLEHCLIALSQVPENESVYLSPVVRDALDRRRAEET